MGSRFFLSLAAFALVAVGMSIRPEATVAQTDGCGAPLSTVPVDHSGETPVFTAIDHDNRSFTVTRNAETGAWALWVISEFTEQSSGVEVGRPCIVIAGAESKLLMATAPQVADTAVGEQGNVEVASAAPPSEDMETYRVTRVAADAVLDLRSGAGTDFPSILRIPPDATGITVGSCKSVDGYRYPWCEASWQGKDGWASACCLVSERTGRRLD